MNIERLDHISILTTHLEAMSRWYCLVLGLQSGYRPPFANNGAWLYADDRPIVHLVEVAHLEPDTNSPYNHFACYASGLSDFLAVLQQRNIDYRPSRVPELNILQINVLDPDGNRIHIDFSPEEADAAGILVE